MKRLRKVSKVLAVIVLAVALLVVLGWVFKLDELKSVFPHFVTMKFTTALCFFLAGTAAFIVSKPFSERGFSEGIALAMISISSLFIVQDQIYAYVYEYDSFWDKIYREISPVFTVVPGRPSIGTLILFVILDAIEFTYLLNLNSRTYLFRRFLAGLVMVCALFALIVTGKQQ